MAHATGSSCVALRAVKEQKTVLGKEQNSLSKRQVNTEFLTAQRLIVISLQLWSRSQLWSRWHEASGNLFGHGGLFFINSHRSTRDLQQSNHRCNAITGRGSRFFEQRYFDLQHGLSDRFAV